MKSKLEKTLRIIAAAMFMVALVVNISSTLSDPFGIELAHAVLTDSNGNVIDDSNNVTNTPTTHLIGLPECPGTITCGAEICIVSQHKNRFMARGCKAKCGYTCTCQKIDLNIGI